VVLLSFFACAYGLTVFEMGYTCPTLLQKDWWPYLNQFYDIFNKNYSIVVAGDGQGCGDISQYQALRKGQVIASQYLLAYCSVDVTFANVRAAGAVAQMVPEILGSFGYLFGGYFPQLQQSAFPVAPVLGCSSANIYAPYSFDVTDNSQGFWPVWSNAVSGMNLTTFIDPPVVNSAWIDFLTLGSATSFSYVCNIIISIAVIVVGSVKLVQFLHLHGFKVELPTLVLLFSVIGGITGLFIALSGFFCWHVTNVSFYFNFFFINWPLACAISDSILMGLYFKEVSCLVQSSGDGATFNVMFWPSVIVLGAAWLIILIAGGFGTNSALNYGNLSPVLAVLGISVAVLAVAFFVCAWGSLSILLKLRGLDSTARGNVVRVIVFSMGGCIINTAFGITSTVMYAYLPSLYVNNLSSVGVLVFSEFLWVFIPCCVIILFMLNFRVTIAKEIEISKSQTSSTSGRSSSSASSSSSSSANDPVIEL